MDYWVPKSVPATRTNEKLRPPAPAIASPLGGIVSLRLPRRQGKKPRTAVLSVRFIAVESAVPVHQRKYLNMDTPVSVNRIELREQGVEGRTCRRLLTTLPVKVPAQAVRMARWYARRWQKQNGWIPMRSERSAPTTGTKPPPQTNCQPSDALFDGSAALAATPAAKETATPEPKSSGAALPNSKRSPKLGADFTLSILADKDQEGRRTP